MVGGSATGGNDVTGARARSFGGSLLGKVLLVLGLVGIVVYNGLVVLAGASQSAAGTWFPVGLAGLGLAMILWGRMKEMFEEHHIH